MTFLHAVTASLLLLGAVATAAAQPGAVYVNRGKVDVALAKGGTIFDAPQARAAGVYRDKPGALDTQKGTSIIYVTDGEGMFAAGARTQRLTKGDVLIVPAGMTQAFTSVLPSISYLSVIVPVLARAPKPKLSTPTTTKLRRL